MDLTDESLYIKEVDVSPKFLVQEISETGILRILEKKGMMKEFESLFEDFHEGWVDSSWKREVVKPLFVIGTYSGDALSLDHDDDSMLDLESPTFATVDYGIFMILPKLSFDSEEEEVMVDIEKSMEEAAYDLAAQCRKHLHNLKFKQSQTFLEVEIKLNWLF